MIALRRSIGVPITITETALAFLRIEALASADNRETGGILLGHDPWTDHRGSTPGSLIRHAGDPGPAAVRRPAFFRRDYPHTQQLALDAFKLDQSVWIGEWHTHPRGPRHPSRTDDRIYRRHLADPALNLERFVALIVTPTLTWSDGRPRRNWQHVRCTAWIVDSRQSTRVRLEVIDDQRADHHGSAGSSEPHAIGESS